MNKIWCLCVRVFIVLSIMVVAAAYPADLPEPGDLVYDLNEEEFEDYLDIWLAIQARRAANVSQINQRSGCSFVVNGDLGQPQPVYLHRGDYIVPDGNSGVIRLNAGEQVVIACTGSGRAITHPNVVSTVSTATATCVSGNLISGSGWLQGSGWFGDLKCTSNAHHDAVVTNERCYNNNQVISVGFVVNGVMKPLYWSCFDQNRLEVLYVWYEQNPPNAVHQSGVDRPGWLVSSFFPGVGINNRYTQVTQKETIAGYLGAELADKYVTSHQFLARGHLAAKTDFVFATGQRSSFYFINAAPQWQPFNAGNWNWLEQNLRARIGAAGYNTMIYTGTFGVSQLRDRNNRLVDIYLHKDANNNEQLPVPLYFYKVVYDKSRQLGTAFVSINNPYYTAAEVRALTFCTDRCRNNSAFRWLNWQPDRIDIGYSFCCEVDDFRRTVPHLPAFTVRGLLA